MGGWFFLFEGDIMKKIILFLFLFLGFGVFITPKQIKGAGYDFGVIEDFDYSDQLIKISGLPLQDPRDIYWLSEYHLTMGEVYIPGLWEIGDIVYYDIIGSNIVIKSIEKSSIIYNTIESPAYTWEDLKNKGDLNEYVLIALDNDYGFLTDINGYIYKVPLYYIDTNVNLEYWTYEFSTPVVVGNKYILYDYGVYFLSPIYSKAMGYYEAYLDFRDNPTLTDIENAYFDGYNDGIKDLYQSVNASYNNGFNRGYEKGLLDSDSNYLTIIAGLEHDLNIMTQDRDYWKEIVSSGADISTSWLVMIISFVGNLFNFEFIPGIKIGYVALIPISLAMVRWVFKIVGGRL